MKNLPAEVSFYRKTKVFDQDSIPGCFNGKHNTKENIWAQIHVLEGDLVYIIDDTEERIDLAAGDIGVVEPQVYHSIHIEKAAKLYIAFYK